ncbi:MAG: pseudouridine-5'-phosphate glycosidase [Bacteriovoracaceae bacterium]|nr:pseudouridine-5'-phosphate glycosidase [Bacteriovoracaceae bacterium]
MELPLNYSTEVSFAIKNNIPIVALESTIITHGMPYPQNVECAKLVEAEIRAKKVVPATIAIINGCIKIGLNDDELEKLGQYSLETCEEEALKISRRDLSYAVANKKTGGTTVSGTMICAKLANIRVFATGGIGGVHREGEDTLDISADLNELSKTNIAVVCAGIKSILDLRLSLEYLETMGVPVLGYKTTRLPAFYSKSSPFDVNYQMSSAKEIASLIVAHDLLKLESGILVTNPIPEKYSIDYDEMETIIERALGELKSTGLRGKEITPFLLSIIGKLSGQKSLEANIELVKNNARLAADIALELV